MFQCISPLIKQFIYLFFPINLYVKNYILFILSFSFSELWIGFDMGLFLLTSYKFIVDFSEVPYGSCLLSPPLSLSW